MYSELVSMSINALKYRIIFPIGVCMTPKMRQICFGPAPSWGAVDVASPLSWLQR